MRAVNSARAARLRAVADHPETPPPARASTLSGHEFLTVRVVLYAARSHSEGWHVQPPAPTCGCTYLLRASIRAVQPGPGPLAAVGSLRPAVVVRPRAPWAHRDLSTPSAPRTPPARRRHSRARQQPSVPARSAPAAFVRHSRRHCTVSDPPRQCQRFGNNGKRVQGIRTWECGDAVRTHSQCCGECCGSSARGVRLGWLNG